MLIEITNIVEKSKPINSTDSHKFSFKLIIQIISSIEITNIVEKSKPINSTDLINFHLN